MPIKINEDVMSELKAQIDFNKNAAMYSKEGNTERYQDSWMYYLRKKPFPLNGRSDLDYVEPVLYEAVNTLTPALLNIFTENDSQAVVFRSKSFNRNQFVNEAVNNTINRLFLRENDGYKVLEDSFKEALVTGDAFIKYFIEEKTHKDKVKLEDWISIVDFVQMADGWDFDIPDPATTKGNSGKYKGMEWKVEEVAASVEQNPVTGEITEVKQPMMFIKGNIKLSKTDKNLKIEQVDIKDLFFDDTYGSDFSKCRYISHRATVTVGDAIDMGFDEELLAEASTINGLDDTALSKQRLVVDGQMTGDSDFTDNFADPLERRIHLWEHYLYTSLVDGKTGLYQITATDNDILSVDKIGRIPFVHGTPETIPGSFWGGSLYDLCKIYQDELSHFSRVIRQNSSMSAFGAWSVVKGAYNRESLLNLRPGAVVEVQDQMAVAPLQIPQLSGVVGEYMNRLAASKDSVISTSVGSITTPEGMPQIAAATAAMTIANEQMKDKVAAKNLARTLIRPLYEGIYETMRAEGYNILNADGSIISASDLPSVYEFQIDINTVNDDAVQTQQLFSALGQITSLQNAVGGIMSQQNLYNAADHICKMVDLDTEKFFTNPEKLEVDPAQVAEQEEIKAVQKETTLIGLEVAKASLNKTVAEIAEIELRMTEAIKDGEAKRARDEEESLRKFKQQESESESRTRKDDTDFLKAQTNAKAVDAEVASYQAGVPYNVTGISSGR